MPSLQLLRRRLKSIKSIHQITRAMEMIATSKMKRATLKVQKARAYSQIAFEILKRLAGFPHPLLEGREIKRIALIFLTADRGLCGGFNSALFKEAYSSLKEAEEKKQEVSIITVGKKGRDFVTRFYREKLVADFTGIEDEILYQEITPIARLAIQDYLDKKYDQVLILYSHFVSSFIQKPTLFQLLPLKQEAEEKNMERPLDYLLEPSPKELLKVLVPQFIEAQIYQTLLESKASEHSARMIAMKNATESAKDLMDELYLTYHSIRQATITAELTDMITAKRAIEE